MLTLPIPLTPTVVGVAGAETERTLGSVSRKILEGRATEGPVLLISRVKVTESPTVRKDGVLLI